MESFTNSAIENTYFLDHDAVKLWLREMLLTIILFYKVQYDQTRMNIVVFKVLLVKLIHLVVY